MERATLIVGSGLSETRYRAAVCCSEQNHPRHACIGAADGFTLVLYPAAQPRLLLLVRVHGITGADSAKVAGAMLRSLGAGAR
jgi:hypothetical protein